MSSRRVYATGGHALRTPRALTRSRSLARLVLVPVLMSQEKDPNQEGRVPDAANEARLFVEREPGEARKAEKKAKRGPKGERWLSVDEIVAKGHSVVERVRPLVGRALGRLRHRFGRK